MASICSGSDDIPVGMTGNCIGVVGGIELAGAESVAVLVKTTGAGVDVVVCVSEWLTEPSNNAFDLDSR